MTLSTERVAVFLVVILGTLCWSSHGANTVVFGSDAVRQQPAAFATRWHSRQLPGTRSKLPILADMESSPALQLLTLSVRGGELSTSDEEDEDSDVGDFEGEYWSVSSQVATKLRNAIRSILQISDDKLPLVSGFLRTCFKTIETITGLDLLPPPESKPKSGKGKSKKKKNSSKSKSGSKSDTTETTKKSAKPKAKSSVPKKATAATKKHLATSIKSSNPNYRIQKELKAFLKSPPPNLSVQVGSNIRLWVVTILGAKDTIYEGEVFKLRIEFPKDYPTVPPSVYFLKKFLPVHEHVYTNGDICLSLLGNGWRPTMSAQSIAVSILSILSSAQSKNRPMDNASHAGAKPGLYQKDWVYHDDNC